MVLMILRRARHANARRNKETKKNNMKLPSPTEHQIQTSIINFLGYKGYYVMRLNSGAIRTDKGNMVRLAVRGTPDLLAFKKVLRQATPAHQIMVENIDLLFVEVKRMGNKPTFAQEQMMQNLTEKGARCLVIHSIEELEKFL